MIVSAAARRVWLLAVACSAVVACGVDAPASRQAAPTSGLAVPAEPDDVDRDAAVAAAVDIRVDGCGPRIGFGTGSLIDTTLVATAAHVVAGGSSIDLIASDGTRTTGEVVLFDPGLDLALVRTAAPLGTPLALRPSEAATGESGVVVLPREADGVVDVETAEVIVLRPATIRTTDIYLDEPVERAGFEIEGSIDPGDSGAMVVLPGGGVGIVWARSNRVERRAWAIDLTPALVAAADLTAPVDVGPCIR